MSLLSSVIHSEQPKVLSTKSERKQNLWSAVVVVAASVFMLVNEGFGLESLPHGITLLSHDPWATIIENNVLDVYTLSLIHI